MNKTIRFSSIRFYMIALSVLLIILGFVGTILQGGFNFGIDFQAGLSQRLQIAPAALEISYDGGNDVSLNVVGRNVRVELRDQEGLRNWVFTPEEYPRIADLAAGLQTIPGVQASVIGDPQASAAEIVTGLGLPYVLGDEPVFLNTVHTDSANYIEIQDVREVLSQLGTVQLQVVGAPVNQEFLVRVQDETGGQKDRIEAQVASLLEGRFGENTLVLKQSDYVGPRFSEALARQSILLTVVAMLLILAYVWFRFKLGFAVSSIAALAHDVLFMLAFIGTFQIEVNTATIAAVLTIIGYSLNDTIVVFDRIRENNDVMKERPFRLIADTSITQSLSRTLITSLTTLIAVLALYIFGTGMIRDFSLNLIVGVVIGTYSSIFIASPVLIGWVQRANKKQAKHLGKVYDADRDIVVEKADAAAAAVGTSTKASEDVRKQIEVEKASRKLKGKRQQKKKK